MAKINGSASTWDEAYDTIVKEFTKVKENYGAESVIFCQGTGRDIAPYISRLAWSFGSPNWAALGSERQCLLSAARGWLHRHHRFFLGGRLLASQSAALR